MGDKATEFAIFIINLGMKSVMRVTSEALENTKHTLLIGDKATEYAISLGNFTIYLGMKTVMRVTSEVI